MDSIVYFRADDNKAQNQADAQLLSDEYLGGVTGRSRFRRISGGLGCVDPATDVLVVLGEDQAGAA